MDRQDYLEAQADYMQDNAAEMREEAKRTCWRCKQPWHFEKKDNGYCEIGHEINCIYFETLDRLAADVAAEGDNV